MMLVLVDMAIFVLLLSRPDDSNEDVGGIDDTEMIMDAHEAVAREEVVPDAKPA